MEDAFQDFHLCWSFSSCCQFYFPVFHGVWDEFHGFVGYLVHFQTICYPTLTLPTSKSSRPFNNPLVTVPKAPITIGTTVTFMFHKFFNSLARSRYLFLFSHSFSFILWSAGTAKSTILQILFFVVEYYKVWSTNRD